MHSGRAPLPWQALGAIASIAAAVIGFLAWQLPKIHSDQRNQTAQPPSVSTRTTPTAGTRVPASISDPHYPATEASIGTPTPTAHLPQTPIEILLDDGQQRIILNGKLGFAITFTRIGEIEFPTLQINPLGVAPSNHALLRVGLRMPVEVAGKDYVVSVTRIDVSRHQVLVEVQPSPP